MRINYATALYKDPYAPLDDLRKAVTTLEETQQITRRVFGIEHPLTGRVGRVLRGAQAALRARGTPSSGGAEVLQTADDLAACFG